MKDINDLVITVDGTEYVYSKMIIYYFDIMREFMVYREDAIAEAEKYTMMLGNGGDYAFDIKPGLLEKVPIKIHECLEKVLNYINREYSDSNFSIDKVEKETDAEGRMKRFEESLNTIHKRTWDKSWENYDRMVEDMHNAMRTANREVSSSGSTRGFVAVHNLGEFLLYQGIAAANDVSSYKKRDKIYEKEMQKYKEINPDSYREPGSEWRAAGKEILKEISRTIDWKINSEIRYVMDRMRADNHFVFIAYPIQHLFSCEEKKFMLTPSLEQSSALLTRGGKENIKNAFTECPYNVNACRLMIQSGIDIKAAALASMYFGFEKACIEDVKAYCVDYRNDKASLDNGINALGIITNKKDEDIRRIYDLSLNSYEKRKSKYEKDIKTLKDKISDSEEELNSTSKVKFIRRNEIKRTISDYSDDLKKLIDDGEPRFEWDNL